MGEIEDSPVNLNDGESKTVILKRDPSTDTANLFANRVNFEYTTSSGTSTLILEKDPDLNADMTYYIHGSVSVKSGSHLIMNLNSTEGQGLFRVDNRGVITADGSTIEINNVNTFVVDAMLGNGIQVTNGSTLNINNVDSLINVSSTSASASIYNNNSTLYIEADVYNYDKNSLEGGGNFTQISNNAKTTIGVLFIILVLIVVSKAEKKP